MARKKIDALVTEAKGIGAKGLPYIALKEDGSVKCSFAKFMSEEEVNALVKAMDGEKGDLLLFAADKNTIVWNVLGALRLKLGEELGKLLDALAGTVGSRAAHDGRVGLIGADEAIKQTGITTDETVGCHDLGADEESHLDRGVAVVYGEIAFH